MTKLFYNTDQGKQECTTKQDMVTACIMGNKRTFYKLTIHHQCAALIVVIGYDAEKEGGRQILDGIFLFPLLEHLSICKKVLDHLRRLQIVINRRPISTFLSTQ